MDAKRLVIVPSIACHMQGFIDISDDSLMAHGQDGRSAVFEMKTRCNKSTLVGCWMAERAILSVPLPPMSVSETLCLSYLGT